MKAKGNLKIIAVLPILMLSAYSLYPITTKTAFAHFSKEMEIPYQSKIIITKTSTLEDLERLKNQLKSEGLGFDYSNVRYNELQEIIAITISYKDKNNNSGTYSVNSERPINDIIIEAEGNQISVRSTGSSNQAIIQQGNAGPIADTDRGNDKASEQMKQEMEEMEKEMEERMAAMRANMEKRDSRGAAKNIREEPHFKGTKHNITPITTDAQLAQLAELLDADGITFRYKNVQRNEKGAITYVSISVDNRAGSIAASSFGDGQNPIREIHLLVDKQHTIMKMAE